jgi:hypothetical protein
MSEMSKSSDNWSPKVEKLLNDIRLNCILLEENHKKKYFDVKKVVFWFKIPIIFMSSLNAITAVALTNYMPQEYISATNCGLSFIIGLLTSLSLYMKVEDKLENELLSSKSYHKMSIDIFKILTLETEGRGIDGDVYLNSVYNEYVKLYERTNLIDENIHDKLKKLDIGFGVSSKDVENV